MKKSFSIKNIISFGKRKEEAKHLFRQRRDWKINITVFLFGIVFVITGSLYFYHLINSERVFNVERKIEDTVRTFDREKVRKFSEIMESKSFTHERIKESGLQIVDPSR